MGYHLFKHSHTVLSTILLQRQVIFFSFVKNIQDFSQGINIFEKNNEEKLCKKKLKYGECAKE